MTAPPNTGSAPTSANRSRVFLAIALLLLLVLAWTGLNGGLSLLQASISRGQQVQAVTQMAFGFFALLSAVTTFWGRRWWPVAVGCFALSLGVAAGVFVVVWNRSTVVVGILTGLGALLIGLAIIWLLRIGARSLTGA
jgi:hypothetical protein